MLLGTIILLQRSTIDLVLHSHLLLYRSARVFGTAVLDYTAVSVSMVRVHNLNLLIRKNNKLQNIVDHLIKYLPYYT